MTIHIFEPHDSIIARDGRPFSNDPGARAATMDFPTPSMIAGLVRTLSLHNNVDAHPNEQGMYTTEHISAVLGTEIHGPLLVQLKDDENTIVHWYAPAPKDAVLLKQDEGKSTANPHRLVPVTLETGVITDLDGLQLLDMQDYKPTKADTMPAFWEWKMFERWLKEESATADFAQHTIKSLPVTTRTHLQMNRETRTNQDGMLFETNGLEFTVADHTEGENAFKQYKRLALVLASTASNLPDPCIASLGGERRLGTLRTHANSFPTCPDGIIESIAENGYCRVFLLTPAFFTQGYRPTWILKNQYGITPTLRAIAIDRPLVLSGWDMNKRMPKPTVRMAPAGTVLFLALDGTPEQRRKWMEEIWMHNISDDIDESSPYFNAISQSPAQFRLDGFGLAAIGTWTEAQTMKGAE